VLIVFGLAGVANYFTGIFEGNRLWNVVPMGVGLFGLLRLIFGALERPLPGLASVLNIFVRHSVKKQLSQFGFSEGSILKGMEFKGGRVKLK
jgi:hypothetical protein